MHRSLIIAANFLSEGKVDTLLESQFAAGRLYAAVSSRPGQSGRADGYILEGRELEVCHHLCRLPPDSHRFLVLHQEDQDWQAEARTRGVIFLYPLFYPAILE